MSTSTETGAVSLRFDDYTMWAELTDGRTLGIPLVWFPRLLKATPAQRQNYRLGFGGTGIHWEDIDEDISVEGLLAGRGDMTGKHHEAA